MQSNHSTAWQRSRISTWTRWWEEAPAWGLKQTRHKTAGLFQQWRGSVADSLRSVSCVSSSAESQHARYWPHESSYWQFHNMINVCCPTCSLNQLIDCILSIVRAPCVHTSCVKSGVLALQFFMVPWERCVENMLRCSDAQLWSMYLQAAGSRSIWHTSW